MDEPLPARGAPADQLQELAQQIRRELALLGEGPTGAWVETVAAELRAGTRPGFYYPTGAGAGLAFRSDRHGDAFGHVHVETAPGASDRALRLARAIVDSLPESIRTLSLGFTGLAPEEEARVLGELGARPGSSVIRRFALERTIRPEDGAALAAPAGGLRLVPIRDVTMEALADLDFRAFRGSSDALLIGPDVAEYRRVLDALLAGEAGRFVDEASTALYRPDPPALVGAILTSERSPREATFLDFLVDPAERGHGHGRYLLRWGFRALRALGYDRVRLWVSESNSVARRLYDSVGFAATHTTTIYRWDRPASSAQPHSAE